MKLLKNRYIIFGICMVVALIISFIIIPNQNERNASIITVQKLREETDENVQITAEMLKTEEVGAFNLPSGTILDKDEIIGKYTAVKIYPEDYLFHSKLKDTEDVEDLSLRSIQEGYMAVSVTTASLASGLSGELLSGDYVNVYVYDEDRKSLFDYPSLTEIMVLSIRNAKAEDIEVIKDVADPTGTNVDLIPAAVTLRVTPEQAQDLITAEHKGKIHFVFLRRGEAEGIDINMEEE